MEAHLFCRPSLMRANPEQAMVKAAESLSLRDCCSETTSCEVCWPVSIGESSRDLASMLMVKFQEAREVRKKSEKGRLRRVVLENRRSARPSTKANLVQCDVTTARSPSRHSIG